MDSSVFLVVGQRPTAVEPEVRSFLASAGAHDADVRVWADHHGTVVSVSAASLGGAKATLLRATGGVEAPAPIGRPLRTRSRDDQAAAPAPVPRTAAPPATAGHTVAIPAVRGPAGSDDHTRPVVRAARLRFEDGTVVPLKGRTVFGREPRAMGGDGSLEVSLMAIDDPERSVSKTHFAIEARGVTLWVEDLGSTNGTRHLTIDGHPVEIEPGSPVRLLPGEAIEFGDLRATVEA
jgi:hypothetical protein